uniref:Uncharacterized protein n=1 Tax=Myotis myotis TaxID=51298 RepID=A0A7J7QU67_MYOMY|nr:hypothetical protein mMyoMyo1_011562 [Myotis myotis]
MLPPEKAPAPPGPPRLPPRCPSQDGCGGPAGGARDHLQEDSRRPGRLPPAPELHPRGTRPAPPAVPPAAAARGVLQGAGAAAGCVPESPPARQGPLGPGCWRVFPRAARRRPSWRRAPPRTGRRSQLLLPAGPVSPVLPRGDPPSMRPPQLPGPR